MNVQPTPPTQTATAQITRPPAPTQWAAGAAAVTQVSGASHYIGVTRDMWPGYGYHEPYVGCRDVDECTDGNFPNNCGPNTLCTNTVGSFSCACVTGSSLVQVKEDVQMKIQTIKCPRLHKLGGQQRVQGHQRVLRGQPRWVQPHLLQELGHLRHLLQHCGLIRVQVLQHRGHCALQLRQALFYDWRNQHSLLPDTGQFFYSHNGWDGDTKKYSQTDKQWTLVAPPGKRVQLRIRDFHVKLAFIFKNDTFSFHQLECCHHDRVQITYESCAHGTFPVDVDLTGHRTDTPVILDKWPHFIKQILF